MRIKKKIPILFIIAIFFFAGSLKSAELSLFWDLNYESMFILENIPQNGASTISLTRANDSLLGFFGMRMSKWTKLGLDSSIIMQELFIPQGTKTFFIPDEAWIGKNGRNNSYKIHAGRVRFSYYASGRILNGCDLQKQWKTGNGNSISIGAMAGIVDKSGLPASQIMADISMPGYLWFTSGLTWEFGKQQAHAAGTMIRRMLQFGSVALSYNRSAPEGWPFQNARLETRIEKINTSLFSTYYFEPRSSPYSGTLFDAGFSTLWIIGKKIYRAFFSVPIKSAPEISGTWGASFRNNNNFFTFSPSMRHRITAISVEHAASFAFDFTPSDRFQFRPLLEGGYLFTSTSGENLFFLSEFGITWTPSRFCSLQSKISYTLAGTTQPVFGLSAGISGSF